MTLLRGPHRPAVAALLLLALGAVLVLFALDVRTWQVTVQRDDLRFRVQPDAPDLWRPSTILPGDPAGLVLSTGDTTEWRSALQSFWLARTAATPQAQAELPTLQAQADRTLQRMMVDGRTAAERSGAANLLGVLSLATAAPSPAAFFRQAITLDPSNAQAKQNLELALRLTQTERPPERKRVRTGSRFGHGHGHEQLGNGY